MPPVSRVSLEPSPYVSHDVSKENYMRSSRKTSICNLHVVAVLLMTLGIFSSAIQANPITDENALPGTYSGWGDWDAQNRLIEGYASEVSVLPGQDLHLHVSANPAAGYRVEIYRLGWYGGAGARLMGCVPDCATANPVLAATQAIPSPDPVTGMVSATWPVTDVVPVGADWVSGYYVAKIRLASGTVGAATVPFIVRAPATRAKVALVQVPENTWQAYNNWGGKSLYDNNSTGGRAYKVSFNRPYARENWSLFDYEIQMVRFLEREGYDVAYQTELDTHTNPKALTGYSLAMVIGHGEYWTKEVRDAFEGARDSRVNLGFFGANIAYWQMRYEDKARTIVEYKSAALDPQTKTALKTDQFRLLNPSRPECRLLGIQYQEGNWSVTGANFNRDYAVNETSLTDPWFNQTGFVEGDVLGMAVGYEWDSLTIGCASPLARVFFQYDGGSTLESAHATRYVAPSGARVFATGSLAWIWQLDDWFRTGDPSGHVADRRLQQFTRNALDDLMTPPGSQKHYPPVASITSDTVDAIAGRVINLKDSSVDQDGKIVSRAWDTNNDGIFAEGSKASVRVSYPDVGRYQVALKVTDNSGLTEIARHQFIVSTTSLPEANLTTNPSFESGTNGWMSWQGKLASITSPQAVDGRKFIRSTYLSGTAFTLHSAGPVSTDLIMGHTYLGSAWVRAGSKSAIGKNVTLKIREKTPDGVLVKDMVGPSVTLASSKYFQRISVRAQAMQSGNQMDIRISMDPAMPKDAFDIDQISLIDSSISPAPSISPIAVISTPPTVSPMLQTVTLFDSSTDVDPAQKLIRAWDLHGTGLFNEGSGPTASLIFRAPGIYPVTLNVSDSNGANSTQTEYVTVVSCMTCPVNNLTANPSFEVWTSGWGSQGPIRRLEDQNAVDGRFIARATSQTSGGAFTLLDSPRTITSTIAGHAYKGTVYVRAGATSSIGKSVQLKIREWNLANVIVKETVSPPLILSAGFQEVSVIANAELSANEMDIRVSMNQPTLEDMFDVDAFTLVDANQ
jgi:PKD repeat protein